jgi:far upstream element-binding protein
MSIGGESIKEMQNSTGCKINVSPASGRDIEREIGLVGTRQAIDLAKRAIMEKVDAVVRIGLFLRQLIVANDLQEQRNRSQGREGREEDRYDSRYPTQQPQGQAPAYPHNGAIQDQQRQVSGGEDPYAAYGGYNNYVAMWYAAMAQQQQQQQQGGPGQTNPPGS